MNDLDMRPMVEAMMKASAINQSLLTGIGWGTIKGINPIKLEITNKIIPPSSQVELSPFCKEWTTTRLGHTHKYDDHDTGQDAGGTRTDVDTKPAIESFTFWRGLQVGDKVCFIRSNDSQKYVILWRDNQFDLEG